MEFLNNRVRAVAIELEDRFLPLYMAVNAIYQELSAWTLYNRPDELPSPYEVKVQLQKYNELQIDALQLTEWAQELAQATITDTLTSVPVPELREPCPVYIFSTTGITFPSDNPLTF